MTDTPTRPLDAPFSRSAIPSAAGIAMDAPDPSGFAPLVSRLDLPVLEPRRPALLVAAAAMEGGERLFGLLAGRFCGHVGVCLLTDRRVMAVNTRYWNPDLRAVPLAAGLTVETWQVGDDVDVDPPTLTLRFAFADVDIVIDSISDVDGGREFAGAVRACAA